MLYIVSLTLVDVFIHYSMYFTVLAGPTEKEAFTLRVHHGGYFTEFNREYVGGEIVYYDHVCVDYINLLELNEIARSLHVVFPYWIWYKPYGDDLYFLVENDEDTLKLDKELSPDRVCDLYFSDPPTAFRPIQTIIPDELRKKQSKDKQVEVETIDDDEGNIFVKIKYICGML